MPLREFLDRDGRPWSAWETVPERGDTLAAEYRDGWLTFQSGRERRRLHPIPAGWSDLSDERLELLCRVATATVSPTQEHPSFDTLREARGEV